MPATRGASGRSPKDESYGENLKAMDASDPAAGDLGTLASGSSDDALVIDPAAVSAAFADQLDDSVMRDALFTLGFDDIPPMSFTPSVGGDDADGDGKDGKKARTTGSNQRAVQKRYRERKKQHTASLEAKVAELQSRIDELESEKREMDDQTDRRAAQGGDESGIASTACGLVDAASIGGDGRMSSACEKARKEYLLKFGERVRHMRSALERGASDGELRQALRGMVAHCLGKNPDSSPSGPALKSMMTSNARMLNREAASQQADAQQGPVSTHSGGSEGSEGGFMAHPDLKTALMRSNEGIVRANGVCGQSVCQSVCGGPLRVTIDGSNPTEEEASAHWITVAGALRDSVPPSEVTKLIRWRDEYVAAISNIYEERQRIGAKLAGVGQSYARTGSRGDDSPPSDESTPGDGTSPIVAETTQGEAFVDTIAVAEALRESVTRELELKMRSHPTLVLKTLSPRTSAAIIVSSYPFLPDAVAIASLMKTWRDDGNSVKV